MELNTIGGWPFYKHAAALQLWYYRIKSFFFCKFFYNPLHPLVYRHINYELYIRGQL